MTLGVAFLPATGFLVPVGDSCEKLPEKQLDLKEGGRAAELDGSWVLLLHGLALPLVTSRVTLGQTFKLSQPQASRVCKLTVMIRTPYDYCEDQVKCWMCFSMW